MIDLPRRFKDIRKVLVGGNPINRILRWIRVSITDRILSGQLFTKKLVASRTKGQDLIEFAIVIPFLLLVVFGVLDLGRLFHAGITITNAARVGTRIAALRPDIYECDPLFDPLCDPSYGPNYFINATRDEAANNRIDLSTTPITLECIDGNSDLVFPANGRCDYGDTFRVTITYDFQLLLDGIISLPNIMLIRSVDMLVQ